MPDKPTRILRNPILDRFDFVPAGDNPEAHITMMKAKTLKEVDDMADATKDAPELTEESVGKMTKADLVELVKAQLLEKEADDATVALTQERDDLKKAVEDLTAEMDELKKAAPVDADDTEAIYKGLSDAQRAHFQKMEQQAKDTAEIAKAERDARITSECVTFVKAHAAVSTLSETDDMEMLKHLKGHEGGKYLDRLSQILKSKVEVAKAGGDEIFTEKGHGQEPELSESAVDRVNKMAAAEIEKDKDLTLNDAVAKILNSDPKLYSEYSKSMSTRV